MCDVNATRVPTAGPAPRIDPEKRVWNNCQIWCLFYDLPGPQQCSTFVYMAGGGKWKWASITEALLFLSLEIIIFTV